MYCILYCSQVVKNLNPKDAIVLKLQEEIKILKKLLEEKVHFITNLEATIHT